jgi:hypothetical protein
MYVFGTEWLQARSVLSSMFAVESSVSRTRTVHKLGNFRYSLSTEPDVLDIFEHWEATHQILPSVILRLAALHRTADLSTI